MNVILEINERPKSIIVERLSKNNEWIMCRKFYNPEGYSYSIIKIIASALGNIYHQEIRIKNGANWQIYNTRLDAFYRAIKDENSTFSVKKLNEPLTDAKLMTFKQFVKWFRETSKAEKGFVKAKRVKDAGIYGFIWFKLYTAENTYSVVPYNNN